LGDAAGDALTAKCLNCHEGTLFRSVCINISVNVFSSLDLVYWDTIVAVLLFDDVTVLDDDLHLEI
jgi:hypothetical protein